MKTYTIQHPVHVIVNADDPEFIELYGINSADETEDALLGDFGEFFCMDGKVVINADGSLTICGSEGCCGRGEEVTLIVPKNMIGLYDTNY